MKLIKFKLAEKEFVVEIEKTKEIIQIPLITRVSNSPNFIEGIANLRGDILQIINFHKIIGLENSPITEKSRLLVLDNKNILYAIIVDSISEIIYIDPADSHIHKNILWLDLTEIERCVGYEI